MKTKNLSHFKPPWILIIPLLCVVLQIAFAQNEMQDPNNPPSPKIKLQEQTIDFGTVNSGTTVKAEINFTNQGNAPLEIKKLKTSCGCMTGSLVQNIYQPGQTGNIEIAYKTKNRKGPTKGYVIISSNDPQQPNVKVNLKANVIQLIETKPASLIFSDLKPGQRMSKSIQVKTKKPLLIDAAIQSPEQKEIKINITPKQQNVTEKGAEFIVSVTPSVIGRFSNAVIFKAQKDSENPIELNTTLVAIVQGPVIAAPQYLFTSIIEGKVKEKTIRLSSRDPNTPLTIEQLDYDKKLLDIKLNHTENNSIINLLVNIDPNALGDKINMTSKITIKAKANAESTTLLIPVKVYKRIIKTDDQPSAKRSRKKSTTTKKTIKIPKKRLSTRSF
jgi:hypothetical protein